MWEHKCLTQLLVTGFLGNSQWACCWCFLEWWTQNLKNTNPLRMTKRRQTTRFEDVRVLGDKGRPLLFFLMLCTCLTPTISCCALHVWKENSGKKYGCDFPGNIWTTTAQCDFQQNKRGRGSEHHPYHVYCAEHVAVVVAGLQVLGDVSKRAQVLWVLGCTGNVPDLVLCNDVLQPRGESVNQQRAENDTLILHRKKIKLFHTQIWGHESERVGKTWGDRRRWGIKCVSQPSEESADIKMKRRLSVLFLLMSNKCQYEETFIPEETAWCPSGSLSQNNT